MSNINAYRLGAGGAPARLAILRKTAAGTGASIVNSRGFALLDWRGARHYSLKSYADSFGTFSGGAGQWYCHTGEYFRNERDAHDIVGRLPHGWYSDCDGNETAVGIVASLPHGKFLAGYRWTSNDERVYFPEVHSDESDAARMAEEHARVFAESARDDDELFQEMTLAELDVEEKLTELQESISLRHRSKFGGFERVRESIEELRKAREELADATRSYERG